MGLLNASFLAFQMPLFGILNAHISTKNTKFWHFKSQKCFMKLPKSLTPFMAFKCHNLVFKTPAFSVYEIDPCSLLLIFFHKANLIAFSFLGNGKAHGCELESTFIN